MGQAVSAGAAAFRRDRQDYNLTVTAHPYRQGRMEECIRLLDQAAEEAQGIALCAADCPEIRRALERVAERRVPLVTFNSDDSGGTGGWCFVGEDSHRAGRVAGGIAAKFLTPGDRLCWSMPTPATPAIRAGRTAFWSGWWSRGSTRRKTV